MSDKSALIPSSGLSLQVEAPKLAPAQLRFNKLLAKVERLAQRLAETQAMADTFRPVYNGRLQPLAAKRDATLREMVLWLDARVQRKGLNPTLLRDTKAVLCGLCEGLAMAGDMAMRAVHDRNSPQSLEDKEKAAADGLQVMMQRMAGVDVDDLNTRESVQEVLNASMERVRLQMMKEQAAQGARNQAKAAAKLTSKPRSAAQIKALALHQDAQGALRTIYRQLASALHPDREPDEGERARKTSLMGQANAAYARRDVMALLTLQLRCEQIDQAAVSRLTTDKMAALTRLLKDQATAAEEDLFAAEDRVYAEFALSPYTPVTEAGLLRHLESVALALEEAVALMQEDLQAVQSDAGLKGWLKLQKKMAKANDFEPDFGEFFR